MTTTDRERADLTASEAADAIGLNYGMSRAQLWRVLKKKEAPPVKNAVFQDILRKGNEWEHITFAEYQLRVFRREGDSATANKTDYPREISGVDEMLDESIFVICSRPDAFNWPVLGNEPIPVELKTLIHGEIPKKPKPAHVIQCVIQMYCLNKPSSDLFYFKPSTGEWKYFPLYWNQSAWDKYVLTWLLEFLQAETMPQRMKNGEADRRALILLQAFWAYPQEENGIKLVEKHKQDQEADGEDRSPRAAKHQRRSDDGRVDQESRDARGAEQVSSSAL